MPKFTFICEHDRCVMPEGPKLTYEATLFATPDMYREFGYFLNGCGFHTPEKPECERGVVSIRTDGRAFTPSEDARECDGSIPGKANDGTRHWAIDKCPCCGGPADRGFSRDVPPAPYLCCACEAYRALIMYRVDSPRNILIEHAIELLEERGCAGMEAEEIPSKGSVTLRYDEVERSVDSMNKEPPERIEMPRWKFDELTKEEPNAKDI